MGGAACAKALICGQGGADCVNEGLDLIRLSVETYEDKEFQFSEAALFQVIAIYDKIEKLADESLQILLTDIGWKGIPPDEKT